jgi:hypothetical protein
MIRLFLKTTDNFLYSTIQNAFRITEDTFREKRMNFDLLKELKNFEDKPLGCVIGVNSQFETKIKLHIKLIMGIFFVFIPIVFFGGVFHFTHINFALAVFATFLVTILASSRLETLAEQYVKYRMAQLNKLYSSK